MILAYAAAVDPFLDVIQVPHATRAGECRLPIVYRKAVQFGVLFRVALARARAVVGDRTIEPWPILGAAVAAIYVWRYDDSGLGAYGEVGLGIQPFT